MKMTRKQFGIAMLGSMLALFFGRFLGLFRREVPHVASRPVRARYWSRGDHLAG